MKLTNLRRIVFSYQYVMVFGIFTIMTFISCQETPISWQKKSQDQVIADFVIGHPEKYSEFGKLLKEAKLLELLSVRGPYTVFIPTDSAMNVFYKEKGVNSFSELDASYKKELAYNHLIASEIAAGDIGLGALRDTNAIGDFLVTEFSGADIIINKHSKISKRNILCANGMLHEIDRIIEPVKVSVYELVKANPSFSLFTKGLEVTGLKDTLQTITFPYGRQTARTRFTILAVPDTVFNRYGIHTIDDLIAHFTNRPDSITFLKNPFYRYMEYHCLGGTYYLSALETRLFPILSFDNNISVTVTDDYKLNLDKQTKEYTGFLIDASNNPAKNGAVHTINDLLPVTEPDPGVFIFDTTDYFDVKQGDYYGKYYMKFHDGQNTFAKVKWEGDYLQYYYKNHNTNTQVNWDCWNMIGFGWIELTTPKIQKGSYKLSAYLWAGNLDYEVYVDGVKSAFISKSQPDRPAWGEFTWTKTEEHKIKVVTITWGTIFWDTIIFTPAK